MNYFGLFYRMKLILGFRYRYLEEFCHLKFCIINIVILSSPKLRWYIQNFGLLCKNFFSFFFRYRALSLECPVFQGV